MMSFINLELLPDELIVLIANFWLLTSNAPKTTRHCVAKYLDIQHDLSGALSKIAIRKISASHPAYRLNPYYRKIELFDSIERYFSFKFVVRQRFSEIDFPLKYKLLLQCNHDDYIIEDIKYMSSVINYRPDPIEVDIQFNRTLFIKCKHCDKRCYYAGVNDNGYKDSNSSRLFHDDFYSLTVKEVADIIFMMIHGLMSVITLHANSFS